MLKTLFTIFCIVISLIFIFMNFKMDLTIPTRTRAKTEAQTAQHSNENARNFSFTDIYGNQSNITKFRDRPVVLHFWATWCAPCREEMPILLQEAYRTPRVTFLLISVDTNKAAIQQFMNRQSLQPSQNVILVTDPQYTITNGIFRISAFPTGLILMPNGTLLEHNAGQVDWSRVYY